ncbi:MAG: TonB-dependent receptor [Flavobacterium sp.]|nr:TonB-dependent receptor [Flavobacterium sp.]
MRNFIFSSLAVLSVFLSPAWLSAQSISGKVVDESGLPLPGVNVSQASATTATVTDFDGNFTVSAKAGDQIQFSFLGYQTQTVAASNGMTVSLKPATTDLAEVVVIGYGTANKRDLTGSIVKVSGKEVADRPNTNPIASLQGKVAGLSVVTSGEPGSEPDIRIRGTMSLYKTKPLYVVDGIFNDNISFINPSDIESMEVLKDPSSLAIFGVRGANGVIIVTTKKGKVGKTTVNFSTSLGVKNITGKPNLANGAQFTALYDQQRINQGAAPYSYYNLYNADTDWVDEISQDSPMISIYNLSVSQATEKNNFYLGFGYVKEEGLVKNELYKKFTFSINDELKVTDKFKVGVGLNGSDSRLPQLHNFIGALNATPIVEPFNEELGVYNQLPSDIGGAQIGNPLADVQEKANTQLNRDTRFVANVFAEIELVKDLKLRGAYLADLGFSRGRGYTPVFNVYAAETDELNPYSGNTLTSVNQFKSDLQQLQQDVTLTYSKEFGKHDFTALLGYTRNELIYSSMSGTVKQFAGGDEIPNDPRWWYLNVFPFGDPTTRLANSDQYDRSTVSYLARVLYNYDGKYIFNASYRRDGSSEIRKFQNFWAFGAAWDVSKEAFMNNSVFNSLKIKGSFGQLGNQFSPVNYPTYPNYTSGSSAVFGEELVPAYILAYRNNPDLKWETITSKEIGVELTTLKNRLSFEANYYDKRTKDLLTFVQRSSSFFTNAGEISSKGLELMASWKDKIGSDFTYTISGNLTTLDNNVEKVYSEPGSPTFEVFDGPSRFSAGVPIGSFYGYVVEGVYQSYADILASPPSALGSYDVGDLKFKDLNGDGVVNADDRTVIGNPTPDFTYGASINLEYKNFSLSADFQGVYGNEIYREWGNGATYAQFNYRSDRLNAWNGAGTSNWEPRLNEASGYNVNNRSTYMIEDGSYLRLRNIQLAYSFDSKFLQNINIQNLRIFVSGQNLFTKKNNSGFSPEAGGTPTRFGVDYGGYPVPSITTIGINATF